jgi:hypothetical protein
LTERVTTTAGAVSTGAGATAALRAPIFVVGSPRSGTSVLTWALGQHSNIFPIEESDWLAKLAVNLLTTHAFGSTRGEKSALSGLGVTREELLRTFGDAAFDLILSRSRARAPHMITKPGFRYMRSPDDPKRRWVDGTPEYSHHIIGFRELFPNARFIHILRDAQSAAISMVNFYKVSVTRFDWNEAYRKWMGHVRSCVAAEQALGSEVVLRIRFSDLMADPQATLTRCLAFAGERFEPACVEPFNTTINSSRVRNKEAFFAQRFVDPDLERRALELSEELLSAQLESVRPSPERLAELRMDYFKRMDPLERMYKDRGWRAFKQLWSLEPEVEPAQLPTLEPTAFFGGGGSETEPSS